MTWDALFLSRNPRGKNRIFIHRLCYLQLRFGSRGPRRLRLLNVERHDRALLQRVSPVEAVRRQTTPLALGRHLHTRVQRAKVLRIQTRLYRVHVVEARRVVRLRLRVRVQVRVDRVGALRRPRRPQLPDLEAR